MKTTLLSIFEPQIVKNANSVSFNVYCCMADEHGPYLYPINVSYSSVGIDLVNGLVDKKFIGTFTTAFHGYTNLPIFEECPGYRHPSSQHDVAIPASNLNVQVVRLQAGDILNVQVNDNIPTKYLRRMAQEIKKLVDDTTGLGDSVGVIMNSNQNVITAIKDSDGDGDADIGIIRTLASFSLQDKFNAWRPLNPGEFMVSGNPGEYKVGDELTNSCHRKIVLMETKLIDGSRDMHLSIVKVLK